MKKTTVQNLKTVYKSYIHIRLKDPIGERDPIPVRFQDNYRNFRFIIKSKNLRIFIFSKFG